MLHEGALSSAVRRLSYYWEKEKRKDLVGPFKYNYHCGATKDLVLIQDPAFIFIVMLFPQATKQDQAFIRDWL